MLLLARANSTAAAQPLHRLCPRLRPWSRLWRAGGLLRQQGRPAAALQVSGGGLGTRQHPGISRRTGGRWLRMPEGQAQMSNIRLASLTDCRSTACSRAVRQAAPLQHPASACLQPRALQRVRAPSPSHSAPFCNAPFGRHHSNQHAFPGQRAQHARQAESSHGAHPRRPPRRVAGTQLHRALPSCRCCFALLRQCAI